MDVMDKLIEEYEAQLRTDGVIVEFWDARGYHRRALMADLFRNEMTREVQEQVVVADVIDEIEFELEEVDDGT